MSILSLAVRWYSNETRYGELELETKRTAFIHNLHTVFRWAKVSGRAQSGCGRETLPNKERCAIQSSEYS